MIYEKWGWVRFAGEVVSGASRGIFLVALVYGVWAYGGTRPQTADNTAALLYLSGALWIGALIVRGGWSKLTAFPIAMTSAILSLAGACLAAAIFLENDLVDSLDDFFETVAPWDPGSARTALFRTGGLMLAFLMLVETLRDIFWRRLVFYTMALVGVSVVAFALLQFMVGGPFQWMSMDGTTKLSFAMYRYWGNAGAFLNLIWPLLAVTAILAIRKAATPSLRPATRHGLAIFWSLAAAAAFGACFLNTSKAGNALAIAGLVMMATFCVTILPQRRREYKTARSRVLILAVGAALLVLAASFALLVPWERWKTLKEKGVEGEGRLDAYTHFLEAVQDAGWTGVGPGGFEHVYFLYYPREKGAYTMAHQDYIQTLVEWGWTGGALWALLLGGGAFGLIRKVVRTGKLQQTPSRLIDLGSKTFLFPEITLDPLETRLLAAAGTTSVVLIALHSLVDFPMQIMSLQMLFLCWIALGYQQADPGETPRA